jgi:hypothetical protein
MAYTGGRPVSGPLPFHQGTDTLTQGVGVRGWLERSPRVAETVLVWAVGIAAGWAPIILALRLIGVL